MKLTRITITGADDAVDPEELLALSAEFPWVEWGVLRGGADRNGSPRFPIPHWVKRFDELVLESQAPVAWALHLCGEVSRHAMAGSPGMYAALKSMTAQRVQLNGYSRYCLPMLALAQLLPRVEFILQAQRHAAFENAIYLRRQHPNVSALWDTSGGRGVDDGWAGVPFASDADDSITIGYAGGIAAENIVRKIELLLAENDLPALRNATTWLDLETGARTDDRFDLEKVRRVLELAKPFVSEAT